MLLISSLSNKQIGPTTACNGPFKVQIQLMEAHLKFLSKNSSGLIICQIDGDSFKNQYLSTFISAAFFILDRSVESGELTNLSRWIAD